MYSHWICTQFQHPKYWIPWTTDPIRLPVSAFTWSFSNVRFTNVWIPNNIICYLMLALIWLKYNNWSRKVRNYFSKKLFMGQSYQCHTLLKNNTMTPNKNISPFQYFLGKQKRSIIFLVKNFMICVLPPTGLG